MHSEAASRRIVRTRGHHVRGSALAELVSSSMVPENAAAPCASATSELDSSGTFETTVKLLNLNWLERV